MKIIRDNGGLEVTLIEKQRKSFKITKITKEQEDLYKISSASVNINSSNIDKDEIATAIGMFDEFDAEEFAVAAYEYYGNKFWNGNIGYFNVEDTEDFIFNNLDEDE